MMMPRREGRKAASKALLVIAESIQASKGRRGRPPTSELSKVSQKRDLPKVMKPESRKDERSISSNKENIKPIRPLSLAMVKSKCTPEEPVENSSVLTRRMSMQNGDGAVSRRDIQGTYNFSDSRDMKNLATSLSQGTRLNQVKLSSSQRVDTLRADKKTRFSGEKREDANQDLKQDDASDDSYVGEERTLKRGRSRMNRHAQQSSDNQLVITNQGNKQRFRTPLIDSQQSHLKLQLQEESKRFPSKDIPPLNNDTNYSEDDLIAQEVELIKNQRESLESQIQAMMEDTEKEDHSIDDDESPEGILESIDHQNMSQANTGSQYQGRWTQEEHDKFMEGLKLFGKDWRRIEEYIGSRSCAQIRSHAQKYFNRLQRDIARGIKRSDELQARIALGKKKKRQHSNNDDREEQYTPNKIKTAHEFAPPKMITSPIADKLPTSSNTNIQIQQIQELLTKLAQNDLLMQLKALIQRREQLSIDVLVEKISREQAGLALVQITNRLHQLAMQSLKEGKFDICNRLIDERNLTQFVCILLSDQVTICPPMQSTDNNFAGQEIIQHVELSPSNFNKGDLMRKPQVSLKMQVSEPLSLQKPQ